jgi:hypothetical protein
VRAGQRNSVGRKKNHLSRDSRSASTALQEARRARRLRRGRKPTLPAFIGFFGFRFEISSVGAFANGDDKRTIP